MNSRTRRARARTETHNRNNNRAGRHRAGVRAAFAALLSLALVATVAPAAAAAPVAPGTPAATGTAGAAGTPQLATQGASSTDPHFFDADSDGLVTNRRPANTSLLGVADGVGAYRVEDTREATAGYDGGFDFQPEPDTTQVVSRMSNWAERPGSGEIVDTAVGFLSNFESPDLVVLRGDSGRWTPRPASPAPTTLAWHGAQKDAHTGSIETTLPAEFGAPVAVDIVNTFPDSGEESPETNTIIVATELGVFAYQLEPASGANASLVLVTERRWPTTGRVLDVHYKPLWSESPLEYFGNDFARASMFGVLRVVQGDKIIVDFLRIADPAGQPSITNAVESTQGENWYITESGFQAIDKTPTGGDLRFESANNPGFGSSCIGCFETLRVDLNLTFSDRTTMQFAGQQRDPYPLTPTLLTPVRAPQCPGPVTGFDAIYFDAGGEVETHVTCVAPAPQGGVTIGGYSRLAGENAERPIEWTTLPAPAAGRAIMPQVDMALPCTEQVRFQVRVDDPVRDGDGSIWGLIGDLNFDNAFLNRDGWSDIYQCSSGAVSNGFAGRAGNVQASLGLSVGPVGSDPLGSLSQATSGHVVTISTDEVTDRGANIAVRPITSSTEIPPGMVMTRLPGTDVYEKIELTGPSSTCLRSASAADRDSCNPTFVEGAPVPVAVMAAPPYVKGTGQAAQITPEFATGTSSSQEFSEFTSSSVGAEVEVGVEIEDPFLNLASLTVTGAVGYERETESSTSEALTVSLIDGYGGSLDNDTIVVNNARYLEYGGEVRESSTGVGLCERATPSDACTTRSANIRVPIGNTITSQTLADLRANTRTNNWWGESAEFGGRVDQTLTHVAGMPGTYLGNAGDPDAELNSYCIGNLDPSQGLQEVRRGRPEPANPFLGTSALADETPQILTSDWYTALASDDLTTQRANIEFGREYSDSFVQSNTISGSVSVKGEWGKGVKGSVQLTLSSAGTIGDSFSTSLGTDTAFSGSVGSIPDDRLTSEQFGWRMFVCKREVVPGLEVWVQNYQVREYGGIYQTPGVKPPEDLGPLDAVAPLRSVRTDLTPTFEWDQPVGTVRDYDIEVEAVGTEDYRRYDNVVEFANYATSSARPDAGSWELPPTESLRQNQLYRWRVISENFFFGSESSTWEYFVTEGPPEAELTIENFPGYGIAGKPVELRRAGSDGGLPVTTSWKVDGIEVASSGTGNTDSFDWVPSAPGRYQLSVEVTNDLGSSEDGRTVVVAPDAAYDTYTTDEDTLMDIAAPGVLANDTGGETAALARDTVGGELSFSGDGSFTWMPEADKCASDGADSFLYRPTGGGITSPVDGLVALYVDCVDDPPVAVDDPFSTDEDTVLAVGAPGVTANDTDIDLAAGEVLGAKLETDVGDGELVLDPDGSFTYTPDADFCGTDSFTYRVTNGAVEGDVATTTITVDCVDDPPRGEADTYDGFINDTLTVAAPGVLTNDTDVDAEPADTLTAGLVSDATDGTVSLQADGSFTYTPDEDTCGEDSFAYQPLNGAVGGDPVTVTLDIDCEAQADDPVGGGGTPPTPTTTPQPATPPSSPPPAGDTCPTSPILLTPENRNAAGLAMWACGMELVGTIWRGEGVLVLLPRGFYSCPAVPQRFWFDTRAEFGFFLLQAKCGYTPLFADTWFGRWLAWDPPV